MWNIISVTLIVLLFLSLTRVEFKEILRERESMGANIYASRKICIILKEEGQDDVGCIRLVHYKDV